MMWIIIALPPSIRHRRSCGCRRPLTGAAHSEIESSVGQTANSLDQLSNVRQLQIANLIRANPRTIAADPHGNPIVRDELLAFSRPREAWKPRRLGVSGLCGNK